MQELLHNTLQSDRRTSARAESIDVELIVTIPDASGHIIHCPVNPGLRGGGNNRSKCDTAETLRVSLHRRAGYAKRKQSEMTKEFRKKIGHKLSHVYGPPADMHNEEACYSCAHWVGSLRVAYLKRTSQIERFRLLILLPSNLKMKDICKAIYGATTHAVDR